MKTTFVNGDAAFVKVGEKHLESTSKVMRAFMNADGLEKAWIPYYKEHSNFYDYGLSFDFVEAGTFGDQKLGYYRYQLSWGGPSDEIRFYHDGTIEYVFMDWGTGIGFDVSNEDWAKWLEDWFQGCCSIDWDSLSPEQIETYEFEEETEDEE